ncbi:hypothetical protein Tco_1230583 [Tanacetum coccineum]
MDLVLDPNGEFSVKTARDFIDDLMLPKECTVTRWLKYIPNIMCPICNSSMESTNHLFFSCTLAKDLLKKVTRWWELEYVDIHSYGDWLDWLKSLKLQNRVKDLFEAVCYVLWWFIWKYRNQAIFGGMKQHDCDIRATNIVLEGLPSDVYSLVNHHTVANEIWDRIKLLIQVIELSLKERECKLYNEFVQFTSEKVLKYLNAEDEKEAYKQCLIDLAKDRKKQFVSMPRLTLFEDHPHDASFYNQEDDSDVLDYKDAI